MSDYKNFHDYANNENPYAFLRNYENNKFMNEEVKNKLDALQKIQPKFIPSVVDKSVISNERPTTVNFIIRNGINENIMKGVSILNRNNIVHDILQHKIVITAGLIEANAKAQDLKDIGFDTTFIKKHRYNISALNYILNVFKTHLELDGMDDVVLNLYKLKSINKQKVLRDKIYNAIKDKISDEEVMNMNIDTVLSESQYDEAVRLCELEEE